MNDRKKYFSGDGADLLDGNPEFRRVVIVHRKTEQKHKNKR